MQSVIANPNDAAQAWCKKQGVLPINHMLVVKESLAQANPAAVKEIFNLLRESKQAAPAASGLEPIQFGVENIRSSLQLIIEYSVQQKLIPRKFAVDDLFAAVARSLE